MVGSVHQLSVFKCCIVFSFSFLILFKCESHQKNTQTEQFFFPFVSRFVGWMQKRAEVLMRHLPTDGTELSLLSMSSFSFRRIFSYHDTKYSHERHHDLTFVLIQKKKKILDEEEVTHECW